jgi:hypothetical protein
MAFTTLYCIHIRVERGRWKAYTRARLITTLLGMPLWHENAAEEAMHQ